MIIAGSCTLLKHLRSSEHVLEREAGFEFSAYVGYHAPSVKPAMQIYPISLQVPCATRLVRSSKCAVVKTPTPG